MKINKGIILAGGSGTRLYPLTKVISKQLLPIHDKPMIYYPLSVLMMARIKNILIISTPQDSDSYKSLLGDGSNLGINIEYKVQEKPDGIGSAFKIGKDFIQNEPVCLILGDNIFHGYDFSDILTSQIKKQNEGATIFGYQVSDPSRFGVVEFSKNGKAISIQEKPKKPKSNYAVVGLYFYDQHVCKVAEKVKPSPRGELEITDINKDYLKRGKLKVATLGKGFAWLDTGTHQSLLEASQFVSTVEKRQGSKIGCIEEIAYKNHWINKKQIKKEALKLKNTKYGEYLLEIVKK
tara:strand:+ start:9962 stop:10840 length:879 start_codon:yes stop_codon:yes gene_type:complete